MNDGLAIGTVWITSFDVDGLKMSRITQVSCKIQKCHAICVFAPASAQYVKSYFNRFSRMGGARTTAARLVIHNRNVLNQNESLEK